MTIILALFQTKKVLGFIELQNLCITCLNFFNDLKLSIINYKGKIKKNNSLICFEFEIVTYTKNIRVRNYNFNNKGKCFVLFHCFYSDLCIFIFKKINNVNLS